MVRCDDGVFTELIDKLVRCDDGDVSTARRLGLLRVEAVPELGGHRVLDRQRVDVARRQRQLASMAPKPRQELRFPFSADIPKPTDLARRLFTDERVAKEDMSVVRASVL